MEGKLVTFPCSSEGDSVRMSREAPACAGSSAAKETRKARNLFLFGAVFTFPGFSRKRVWIPQTSLVNNKYEPRPCQGCHSVTVVWSRFFFAEALEGWGLALQEAGGLL